MTSWLPIANQDVIDKVFGKQLYNKIRNNLIRLKELYDLDHAFEIGTHEPSSMFYHWAKAVGIYKIYPGGGAVETNSHNISGVDHVGEGTYKFNFIDKISANALASSTFLGTSNYLRTCIKSTPSTRNVTVLVYDQNDNLYDLIINDAISVAVMRYI